MKNQVKMVSVLMNRNQTGSPDGIAIELYKSGEKCSIPESLAKVFVEKLKCASYVNPVSNIAAAVMGDAKKIEKAQEDSNFNPLKNTEKEKITETKVNIRDERKGNK